MSDVSEEALVERIAAGDPKAMSAFVALALPRVLALATRMLGDAAAAEDVAQETFVRIWQNAAKWRPGAARFATWVHRVAMNLCYDHLRRRIDLPTDQLPEVAAPVEDEAVDAALVEAALQAIAPRQREAIVLVYYQGLSNIEAAAVMGLTVDALESLLARGRRSLQARLIKDIRDDDE